jgi:hypothetical protein
VTTLYTVAAVGELLSLHAVQFPIGDYAGEAAELAAMTREEVVGMLKRGSTGFSRGRSKYRGVTSEQAVAAWQGMALCTRPGLQVVCNSLAGAGWTASAAHCRACRDVLACGLDPKYAGVTPLCKAP